MKFSQERTQIEQFATEQLINATELLTSEAFIEAELSPDDLKQVVGGAIEADLGGAGLEV
jgi:hypothetical protein